MKFKTIFHIDDDTDDTELFFSAALEASNNVAVEVFLDSHKALQKLIEITTPPDAIFLDLNMPIMDVFQFLREIKSNEGLKEVPIIILSKSSRQETIDALRQLGAAGFITKPSNYYHLVDILKTYL